MHLVEVTVIRKHLIIIIISPYIKCYLTLILIKLFFLNVIKNKIVMTQSTKKSERTNSLPAIIQLNACFSHLPLWIHRRVKINCPRFWKAIFALSRRRRRASRCTHLSLAFGNTRKLKEPRSLGKPPSEGQTCRWITPVSGEIWILSPRVERAFLVS